MFLSVKVKVKKASNALKNKNSMNKPVLDSICKKSAAFNSSLPVKPITK